MMRSALISALPRTFAITCVVLTFVARIAWAEAIEVDSVLIRLIREVDIPARALGSLSAILVTEGKAVQQGELLAQIDDTEARLRLQRAEFELEMAQLQADNDVPVRSAEKSHDFARAEYGRLSRAEAVQPRSVSASELEKTRAMISIPPTSTAKSLKQKPTQ